MTMKPRVPFTAEQCEAARAEVDERHRKLVEDMGGQPGGESVVDHRLAMDVVQEKLEAEILRREKEAQEQEPPGADAAA